MGEPPDKQRPAKAERIALVIGATAASWLLMQVIHEAGHVAGALVRGVPVDAVHVHPLMFSRTDLGGHTDRVIVFGGFVVGSLAPVVMLLGFIAARLPGRTLALYFTGFCLVANGAYLAAGWVDRVGDSGDLMKLGVPVWAMIVPGVAMCAGGFYCWHRLGPGFGLNGVSARQTRQAAIVVWLITGVVVAAELAVGGVIRLNG